MTLEEIKSTHIGNESYITDDRDKFFANPYYAVHYHDQVMNGFYDGWHFDYEANAELYVFDITDEDRKEFKIEDCIKSISLYTDNEGWIVTDEHTVPYNEIIEPYCDEQCEENFLVL